MEKERPSHKWTSNETNLSCEILADPVKNVMKKFREKGAKKAFSSEVLDSIIAEFKENVQFKEKNLETLKQKRKRPN